MQKVKRTENTAKLICTGRDIEERELFLEFKKTNFIWETLTPIEVEEKQVDEMIILVSEFVKSVDCFTGTATELAEQLKNFNDIYFQPHVLKKKIIKHMNYLNENNISYSENRTFERREFSLVYDGNEGMTAETSL